MNGGDAHLGNEYRKRRVDAGLSQEQLAHSSGVGRTRLSHFETGKILLKEHELAALRDVLSLTFERRRQEAERALANGINQAAVAVS